MKLVPQMLFISTNQGIENSVERVIKVFKLSPPSVQITVSNFVISFALFYYLFELFHDIILKLNLLQEIYKI